MEVKFFFDTYALVEITKANPNYLVFTQENITIIIFNLVEFFSACLKDFGEEKAKELYNKFKSSVVEIDDETIFESIKFRQEHKRKDLSYTDCLGYIFAKRNNLIFLTGDKEFETFSNVKFVK